jgi:hypothetical protein
VPVTNTFPNAFSIMAASQRRLQLGDNGLPFPEKVKDGRDRLYNDLISLMREMGVKWSDPGVFGVAFLKNLRDVLWYIDGHHDTIAAKVHPVPQVFAKFNGYNCPQAHKHRKRTKGNLSCSEISQHSLVLQDNLQASWFKKDCYKALRDATEDLMGSLSSYAAYLKEKSKSQKMHPSV